MSVRQEVKGEIRTKNQLNDIKNALNERCKKIQGNIR